MSSRQYNYMLNKHSNYLNAHIIQGTNEVINTIIDLALITPILVRSLVLLGCASISYYLLIATVLQTYDYGLCNNIFYTFVRFSQRRLDLNFICISRDCI